MTQWVRANTLLHSVLLITPCLLLRSAAQFSLFLLSFVLPLLSLPLFPFFSSISPSSSLHSQTLSIFQSQTDVFFIQRYLSTRLAPFGRHIFFYSPKIDEIPFILIYISETNYSIFDSFYKKSEAFCLLHDFVIISVTSIIS